MTKAEEIALETYPGERITTCARGNRFYAGPLLRTGFAKGYERAEKDTIAEVEKWLKANFHHRNCWNADEFCISLRTYFGIEK